MLKPNVHLAAALAAEAGSVARAVAMQASKQNTARSQPPRDNGDYHDDYDHHHHDNKQLYHQPSVPLTPSLV